MDSRVLEDIKFLVDVNKDPGISTKVPPKHPWNDTQNLNREAMMESLRHLHLNIPPSLVSGP